MKINSSKAIFCAISIVWLLWVSGAAADPSSFTPARFTDGEFSLERLIEYPDVENDSPVVVYCSMDVLDTGKVQRNHCFDGGAVNRLFHKPIQAASRRAKVMPAKVDGETQRVMLNYRVVFLKQNEETFIGVYSNWGNDIEKYGVSYEAPQRYSEFVRSVGCYGYGNWVTMAIGADGILKSEIEFRFRDAVQKKTCRGNIQRLHERAKYIPGHYEDKPFASTYMEAWGDWDDMELE